MNEAIGCRHAFGNRLPSRLGVAVSGGGDSMALLHILHRDFPDLSVRLEAVTVDHGLRPAAADEAAFVASVCDRLGVPHTTLRWEGWDGTGNLQAEARAARYRLISDWALAHGCDAVALGHTADDQAETVLLNFARGSGVDGLSGMAETFAAGGVRYVRPLLHVTRADLRSYLEGIEARWVEDPSNDDPRFDRVRARRLLSELGDLGLTPVRLIATAERMQDARAVLVARAAEIAADLTLDAGDVLLPLAAFRAAPADTRHRLLASVLCTLSGQAYRPRFRPLRDLAEALAGGGGGVLHGCHASCDDGTLRITREAAALDGITAAPGDIWDGRFRIFGPALPGDEVRAMGDAALGPLPAAHRARLPRRSLMASPAIWRNGEIISAPLADVGEGWTCEGVRSSADFVTALLSR